MKIFAQAGFAAAALTVAASFALPVAAADLGGWGRGSIKDDYGAPPRAAAGPCYFRADVGYSWSTDPTLRWAAQSAVGTPYNETVTRTSMGDTTTGGVGVGCGTGSRGFRYEFMMGYHGQRAVDGRLSPYNNGAFIVNNGPVHSSITTYTGMVNGYFDLGNFRGVVPYVGLGVGLAYHQMDEYQITSSAFLPQTPWKVHGDNDLTLAWSAMAGFAYQVSDRAILDLGYRYIDFGRASTARHDVFAAGNLSRLAVDDMGAHEIKVGLRYHIGGDSCCAARPTAMK